MLTSNLAFGPMSKEVIEAIFRYSSQFCKQLMLICSRNQIDTERGYVFRTKQYMEYIAIMRNKYPQADVVICRDHCGPSFGNEKENSIDNTKKTIKCDLDNGFDLIHIDLCLAEWMSHADKLEHTLELMKYAMSIRSDVMFEIGTDKNIGVSETDVNRIITDVETCQGVTNPVFYVVQTGSLVHEIGNAGTFRSDIVRKMSAVLHSRGTKLKEHNADYLTTEQIKYRDGIVDSLNIAPQLGVVQTSHVLSQAIIYGIDINPFIHETIIGNNWKKWSSATKNRFLCAIIAGHYHFNGYRYKEIISQLELNCDIRESIICEIMKVIDHYSLAFGGML